MTIRYECDRCEFQTLDELHETVDARGKTIHLCDDCCEERIELDKAFMENKKIVLPK